MGPRVEIAAFKSNPHALLTDLKKNRYHGRFDPIGPVWTVVLPLAVYTNTGLGGKPIYTFAFGQVGEALAAFRQRYELFSSQSTLLTWGTIAFRLEIKQEVPDGKVPTTGYGVLSLEELSPELREVLQPAGLAMLKKELGFPIAFDPNFDVSQIDRLPITPPIGLSA